MTYLPLIADDDAAYHHSVSPQEVWGNYTCAERAFGKSQLAYALQTGEVETLLSEARVALWRQQCTYTSLYSNEGLNTRTVCAYCHGSLDEPPLPDDYPIGKHEVPNSPLTSIRQQLQSQRNEQK